MSRGQDGQKGKEGRKERNKRGGKHQVLNPTHSEREQLSSFIDLLCQLSSRLATSLSLSLIHMQHKHSLLHSFPILIFSIQHSLSLISFTLTLLRALLFLFRNSLTLHSKHTSITHSIINTYIHSLSLSVSIHPLTHSLSIHSFIRPSTRSCNLWPNCISTNGIFIIPY